MKNLKAKNQETESQQTEDYGEPLSLSFMDAREVAQYLKVRPSTIYSMTGNRKIPFYRIGRQLRFRKSEVDKWMQSQKEPAVGVKLEAKKVFRSMGKKSGLDVDLIVKKAIEGTRKKEYTVSQEKPGRIKGLETEVTHGII